MASLYEALPAIASVPSPVAGVAAADARRVLISCDDGSLRAYAARDDPLSAHRPTYALAEVVARFTKDRRPARALLAVPQWRALLSIAGAGGSRARAGVAERATRATQRP